jgi:hypothetical protein
MQTSISRILTIRLLSLSYLILQTACQTLPPETRLLRHFEETKSEITADSEPETIRFVAGGFLNGFVYVDSGIDRYFVNVDIDEGAAFEYLKIGADRGDGASKARSSTWQKPSRQA